MNAPSFYRLAPTLSRHFLVSALSFAMLTAGGCFWKSSPDEIVPAPKPPALRVIVIDDPALGAALAREWLAHTESALELVEVPAEKAAAAEQLPADVVIYSPAMLGQFASADLLLPLDEKVLGDPDYAREDIFPLLISPETIWGRRTVAAPLGSPQLVLFYRADLLAHQQLKPPTTWKEYATIVEKLATKPVDAGADDQTWQAAAEPLGAGWGGRLLMARAASSAVHRDQLSPLWDLESLEPLIAGPPWVRALEELVADHSQADKDAKLLTPLECYEKFQAGESALAIAWPGVSTKEAMLKLKPEQIGMALLPGSREVYQPTTKEWETVRDKESLHVPLLSSSGRVASVTRASSQPRAATQFVLWLSGPTMSGRIAPVSAATTVFRASHFRNGGTWQASPENSEQLKSQLSIYGELLNSVQEYPRRLSAPRIPGEHEYLAALDAAVLSALKGDQPAAEALQQAATQWREITKRRGVTLQQRALRRSLGLID